MIEIKNIKMYEDHKAAIEKNHDRCNVIDKLEAVIFLDKADEDTDYRVGIMFRNINNRAALFDTLEKAQKFYEALKALLPDSDSKLSSIDCKDFE